MPRIAATGIVLALVAAAIGLNMARYPTVWQMAAPPAQSPPPEETARPDNAARPAILAPVGGPGRDTAPPPIADRPPRATMMLPIDADKADAPPANPLRQPPATGEPADSNAEPLAEYRRQRDANGLAAAGDDAPSAVALPVAAPPSAAPPPTAPQPPAAMSKEWPSEAAAALRVVASPAPPKTPVAAIMPKEKKGDRPVVAVVPVETKGDNPVLAETKTGTVPVVKAETVAAAAPVDGSGRLPPAIRPVSVASTPAADGDSTIHPLPSVDSTTAPPPAPPDPGGLQPVYPSTGMP